MGTLTDGSQTENIPRDIYTNGAGEAPPASIFDRYQLATWTVSGFVLAFPAHTIREVGGNRIIRRERPYRDGAKLDDTGSTAKVWTMDVCFNNTIQEPGMDAANNGEKLYPNVLNTMILLFDVHQTGDLVVPTIGKQRVRAESYTRQESYDMPDTAIVSFTFVEDNEDSVDFRSIQAPTANANARQLAESFEFDSQSSAAWNDDIQNLGQLNRQLENLANAPGDVNADVEQQSRNIQGTSRAARRAFSAPAKIGRTLYNDPENSRGPRKLAQQEDLAARAANESRRGRPQLIVIVFTKDTDLFSVSSLTGQDVADLIEVNPEIDPFFIPANEDVHVFATEEFLNASTSTA